MIRNAPYGMQLGISHPFITLHGMGGSFGKRDAATQVPAGISTRRYDFAAVSHMPWGMQSSALLCVQGTDGFVETALAEQRRMHVGAYNIITGFGLWLWAVRGQNAGGGQMEQESVALGTKANAVAHRPNQWNRGCEG